jgi:serine/threonine-protein kinase OSR1/STK39
MTECWPLEASRYKLLGIVGKGSFSRVYHAECLDNQISVAVKVMDLENVSSSFEDILQVTLQLTHMLSLKF